MLGIEVWVGGDEAETGRSHITWALGRGLETDCKEKPLEGIYRLRICFLHPNLPVPSVSLPCFTFLHKRYFFLIMQQYFLTSDIYCLSPFHSVSSLRAETFSY